METGVAHWVEHAATEKLLPSGVPGFALDDQGGWYFWDETGGAAFGPYKTRDEAVVGVKAYAEQL